MHTATEDTSSPTTPEFPVVHTVSAQPPASALGRFEIRGKLGTGGLGVVYEGYDPELQRRVAIKLVRAEARENEDGAAAQARLLREAQAMAKLSHHNVIHVYDVGALGDRVYVAMELVDGGSLREWLSERPRRWREVLAIFVAAGRGLCAAHAAGLVHRDFKPENVLVDRSNRPFVVDFGLARACQLSDVDGARDSSALVGDFAASTEGSGLLVGTPNYMAPEQFAGGVVGPAADQFAFCVSMWEAVFGERPFGAQNLLELAAKVTTGIRRPAPPGRRVPGSLRKALDRGLRVAPHERWPSMEALCDRLVSVGRARGRTVVALGLVSTAIASAAAGQTMGGPDSCAGSDEMIASVWNASRATALRERFDDPRVPFSAATAAVAIREIGAVAEEWSSSHRSACETAARGEEPPNVHAAQVSCLDIRRRGLGAAINAIERVDSEDVREAVRIAQALPRPSTCLDASVIGPWIDPPADPETARAVEELRGELAEQSAGALTGLKEAEIATEMLANEAQALGYPPLVAEAALVAGDVHDRAGHVELARDRISTALWIAQGIPDLDTVTRAATQLVYIDGATQSDFSRAQVWERLADASLRARGEDARLRADLDNAWAGANLAAARLDEAAIGFDRAIEAYSSAFPRDDPRLVPPMNNAAIVAARRGDFAKADGLLESALAIAESAFGPSHPDVATLLHTMGEVAFNAGDLTRARAMFERAIEVRESALGDDHPLLATTLHNLAIVRAMQDDEDEAEPLLKRALAISAAASGDDNPAALMMRSALANLEANRKHFDAALDAHRSILAAQQKTLRTSHPEITKTMGNVAADLIDLGRDEEARTVLLRQLALVEQEHGTTSVACAEPLRRLGDLDRKAGDRAAASARYERVLSFDVAKVAATDLIAAKFGLARVLGPENAARARTLAEEALAHAREVDDERAKEIATWLDTP